MFLTIAIVYFEAFEVFGAYVFAAYYSITYDVKSK